MQKSKVKGLKRHAKRDTFFSVHLVSLVLKLFSA